MESTCSIAGDIELFDKYKDKLRGDRLVKVAKKLNKMASRKAAAGYIVISQPNQVTQTVRVICMKNKGNMRDMYEYWADRLARDVWDVMQDHGWKWTTEYSNLRAAVPVTLVKLTDTSHKVQLYEAARVLYQESKGKLKIEALTNRATAGGQGGICLSSLLDNDVEEGRRQINQLQMAVDTLALLEEGLPPLKEKSR